MWTTCVDREQRKNLPKGRFNMILGFLVGLVVGCFIGTINFWYWHSAAKRNTHAYIEAYWGTPIIVIGCAILGALLFGG